MQHISLPSIVIGLIIGGILTAGVMSITQPDTAVAPTQTSESSTNTPVTDDHDMMGHDTTEGSMSMDAMNQTLETKTGDEFDKAFIDLMIEHHEGAIDMAVLAKANAKHEEIKQLSDEIISAQQKEITQMKEWMSAWGY